MVEVNLEVVNGNIVKGIIYSDSLFPDLIDLLNKELNAKKVFYTSSSFDELRTRMLKHSLEENKIKMVEEFTAWIKMCIRGE